MSQKNDNINKIEFSTKKADPKDNKRRLNGANEDAADSIGNNPQDNLNPQNTQNAQNNQSKKVETRGRKGKNNNTNKDTVDIVVEVTNENGREVIDLLCDEANENPENDGNNIEKDVIMNGDQIAVENENGNGLENNGTKKRKRRTKKEMEEAKANEKKNTPLSGNDLFKVNKDEVEVEGQGQGQEENTNQNNENSLENKINEDCLNDKKLKKYKVSKQPKEPKQSKEVNQTKQPKPAKTPKENKPSKPAKNSQVLPTNLTPPVQIDSIFDLQPYMTSTSSSKSSKSLPNTDMILAIMELCYNSPKYNISIPSNTREFWKKVYENPQLEAIFNKFQPETLRKYWRSIREANNPEKIIEIIKAHMEDFNGANVKLLPVINAISNFIISKAKSFDSYLKHLTSSQNISVTTKEKKKMSQPAGNISRKRPREDGIEEDIKQLTMIIQETDQKRRRNKIIYDETSPKNDVIEIENDPYVSNSNVSSSRKKARRTGRLVNIELNQEDIEECKQVEEIVETLNKIHPEKSSVEVLETLQRTSFDIENANLVLNDTQLFKGLSFDEPDDRTIKFLENSTTYDRLVNLKGEELVEQRKGFLKL